MRQQLGGGAPGEADAGRKSGAGDGFAHLRRAGRCGTPAACNGTIVPGDPCETRHVGRGDRHAEQALRIRSRDLLEPFLRRVVVRQPQNVAMCSRHLGQPRPLRRRVRERLRADAGGAGGDEQSGAARSRIQARRESGMKAVDSGSV